MLKMGQFRKYRHAIHTEANTTNRTNVFAYYKFFLGLTNFHTIGGSLQNLERRISNTFLKNDKRNITQLNQLLNND